MRRINLLQQRWILRERITEVPKMHKLMILLASIGVKDTEELICKWSNVEHRIAWPYLMLIPEREKLRFHEGIDNLLLTNEHYINAHVRMGAIVTSYDEIIYNIKLISNEECGYFE